MKMHTRFLSVVAATLFITALIASCGGGGGGGYTAPPAAMLNVATLKAEGYYFNVHTNANPNGEIRGQINANPAETGTVTIITTLEGIQEVPPVTTTLTGTGTLTINHTTGQIISASVTVSNPAVVTAAHIHEGPLGSNVPGTIILALPYSSGAGGGGGGGY